MSVFNFSHLNTAHGAKDWCAPSDVVDDYEQWLIDAMSKSQGIMQYFSSLAREMKRNAVQHSKDVVPPVFSGPYADTLKACVTTRVDFIAKESFSRRQIRIKANKELSKKQESERSEVEKRLSSKKRAAPKKLRSEPLVSAEEWVPSSEAKQKQQDFMALFKAGGLKP